jgi:hypothetical protein
MPYVCVMLLLQDRRILANGRLVGPKRPALNFAGIDLLAHGLSFGLQLRF